MTSTQRACALCWSIAAVAPIGFAAPRPGVALHYVLTVQPAAYQWLCERIVPLTGDCLGVVTVEDYSNDGTFRGRANCEPGREIQSLFPQADAAAAIDGKVTNGKATGFLRTGVGAFPWDGRVDAGILVARLRGEHQIKDVAVPHIGPLITVHVAFEGKFELRLAPNPAEVKR